MSDTPNTPTPRTDAIVSALEAAMKPYNKYKTTATAMLLIAQYIKIAQLEIDLTTLQAEVVELKRTNQALLAHFQHYHVNNGIDDTCKECGFDLRHEIHFRAKEKQP